MNNEEVGISAEVAIADAFDVSIDADYRNRGDVNTINEIKKIVPDIFSKHKIPTPITHIAEGQNPADFKLEGGKTLSVKTNKSKLGKVAPQNVGQPTAETYFEHFNSFADDKIPSCYNAKRELFKQISVSKIDELLKVYWENLFHCDYYIHFYDVCSRRGLKYIVFKKINPPTFEKDKISFTHIVKNRKWNESTTVKYDNISIGEFQAHQKRNCLKFRFNIEGVIKAFSL
jgi:hypothetical protein